MLPLILTNNFGEKTENQVQGLLLSGATAPVDGTTGAKVSPKGGLYIAADTGALYQNTGTLAVPAWAQVGAGVLTQALAGFSAGAGTLSSADTVLQAFDKLAGNTQNKTVLANVLTGLPAGTAQVITAADTVLSALANLQAQISAL